MSDMKPRGLFVTRRVVYTCPLVLVVSYVVFRMDSPSGEV